MLKLFRRKSKKTEPTVPLGQALPVDVPDESPTAAAAQPMGANGGPVEPTPPRPYEPPVTFARPWAIDQMIRVDEHWLDGTLVVRVELPGAEPDRDVRLTVVNGRLVIEAERREEAEVGRDGLMVRELRYGAFSNSLPLAAGVTAASITATYDDGLLEVHIPAAATQAPPPKRIPIITS